MDSLISRKAAIDALDGEIEITGRTNAEAVKGYVRLVRDRLERLSSAQPEIIRCKDCVHWWESHKMCKRNKDKNHNCACMDCDADFYCKNAERRTDELRH